jgi:cytochrome c oxidase subunit 6a
LYDKRRTRNMQEDGIDERNHQRSETHHPGTNRANNTTSHSGIPPCLVLAGANAYYLWNEHWEHWAHMPPLEERVEYPFQNIRTRNFPWGDGDKVCSTTQSLGSSNQAS